LFAVFLPGSPLGVCQVLDGIVYNFLLLISHSEKWLQATDLTFPLPVASEKFDEMLFLFQNPFGTILSTCLVAGFCVLKLCN
jgi:hypothetical protein